MNLFLRQCRRSSEVRPVLGDPIGIDLFKVVQDLRQQRIEFPLLIRFQDLLRSRVAEINTAFRKAIEEAGYQNAYISVYPIKVNQLHEVVQEILEAGRPFGFGLECGSKAELVAALPHLEDDRTLLICNGYKDGIMIRLLLIGQQLGKNVIPILEKYSELRPLMLQAKELGHRSQVRSARQGIGDRIGQVGGIRRRQFEVRHFHHRTGEAAGGSEHLRHRGWLQAASLPSRKPDSRYSKSQAGGEGNRARLRDAARRRGVDIQYVNVGGGLGVNYEAGEVTSPHGINYTLEEYVNAVVYSVKEVCDAEKVPHPILVSESGRALTAHHSVLIVEAIAANVRDAAEDNIVPESASHQLVNELARLLGSVTDKTARRRSLAVSCSRSFTTLPRNGRKSACFLSWDI